MLSNALATGKTPISILNANAEKMAEQLKMTIREMIDHVWLETHLMMGSQRARLLGGLIEQPDGDQILRIAKNNVVIRFLESELRKRAG